MQHFYLGQRFHGRASHTLRAHLLSNLSRSAPRSGARSGSCRSVAKSAKPASRHACAPGKAFPRPGKPSHGSSELRAGRRALSIRHTQLAALCCANGTGNVHIHKSCCDKKVTPPLRSTAWPHLQARQRAFPLRHGRVGARHVVQRALLFRIRRAPALQSSCSINSRKDKGRALALPRPPRERAREEALQDHARLRSTAPKLQHVRSGNTPAAHGCWAT